MTSRLNSLCKRYLFSPIIIKGGGIQETVKLGFKKVIIPFNNYKSIKSKVAIEIIPIENLTSAIKEIFS